MTLETGRPGATAQNECGQHGQCRKNPLHLEPPFACPRLVYASWTTPGKSGCLVDDLRAYLAPIPARHENDTQ